MAAEVDPERLVFVDEMGVHTSSLAPLCTVTLQKANAACGCRFHAIAAETRRF